MVRLFRVNGITRHHIEQAFVHLTLPCKRTRWHFKTGSSRGEPGMFLVFLTVLLLLDVTDSHCLRCKVYWFMHVAVWQARSRASPSSGSSNSSNCHYIASEMEAWSEAAVAMRILRHRLWPEKFLLMENLWKNVVPFWKQFFEYRNVQSGSGGLSLSKSKKGHLEAELKLIWGKRLG